MVQQILYALCLQNMFTAQFADRSRVSQVMRQLMADYEDDMGAVHRADPVMYGATSCGRLVKTNSFTFQTTKTETSIHRVTCPRCLLMVRPPKNLPLSS